MMIFDLIFMINQTCNENQLMIYLEQIQQFSSLIPSKVSLFQG